MKRIIIAAVFLALTSLTVYAIEREFASDTGNSGGHTSKNVNQNGQSNFERVGVSGNQVAGNAGFIVFNVSDPAGVYQPYYLWLDTSGNLCEASYPTISLYASFPNGDWRTGMPCSKIGSQ